MWLANAERPLYDYTVTLAVFMNEVEQLLKPVSVEEPCGKNLSYDPGFLALEGLIAGKPETQFSAAEEPDCKAVRDAWLNDWIMNYCVDPNGEEIYYQHPRSGSGGELDVDSNFQEPYTDRPVENIYLPKGKGALSWLGIGRRPGQVEVDLYMDRTDTTRESMVQITVAMRPQRGDSITDASWRARCDQIFCDLRGYLMGQNGPVSQGAVV